MGGIVNWMGGWPKEGLLSASEWEARCAELARKPAAGVGPGGTQGIIRLREKLAEDGLLAGPSEDVSGIALAPGADAALDRVARGWLAPGDAVLAERLTSRSALQHFRKAGAAVHAVAADRHGMLPEELRRAIARRKPRLVYAAPGGTDPDGRVWSEERRRALLEICAEAEVPVLIDNRQAGLQYDSATAVAGTAVSADYGPGSGSGDAAHASDHSVDPAPAASALRGSAPSAAHAGTVWTVGELPPGTIAGLRFGWLSLNGRRPRGAERIMDSRLDAAGVPIAEQHALLSLIEAKELEPLLLAMRFICRAKIGLLIEQLERRQLPGVAWREPQAGMHLWLELPEGLEGDALLRAAWLNGLLFQPGGAFYAAEPRTARVRLTPVHSDEKQIRAGVSRLAETMGEFLGRWV